MYIELIKEINNKCRVIGGYDLFLLKEIFTRFCRQHRIRVNSPNWLYVVDLLWCDLDTVIRYDFDDVDDLDTWLKDYFI